MSVRSTKSSTKPHFICHTPRFTSSLAAHHVGAALREHGERLGRLERSHTVSHWLLAYISLWCGIMATTTAVFLKFCFPARPLSSRSSAKGYARQFNHSPGGSSP